MTIPRRRFLGLAAAGVFAVLLQEILCIRGRGWLQQVKSRHYVSYDCHRKLQYSQFTVRSSQFVVHSSWFGRLNGLRW